MALPSPIFSLQSLTSIEEVKIEVPAEIWDQIIRLVRRPLPRPTRRKDRSAIKQPDLATCMRVCKLFNNLTAPLLYTTIITDSLPLLVINIDRSASVEGILSKRQLFGYTESLSLEYSARDQAAYPALLADGSLLSTLPSSLSDLHSQGLAEALAITAAANSLAGRLRSLWTLSTPAYLDPQPGLRESMYLSQPDIKSVLAKAGSFVVNLTTGLVRAHCQIGGFGPLTFNYVNRGTSYGRLTRITHLETDGGLMPTAAIVDRHSQWIVRFDALERQALTGAVSRSLARRTMMGNLLIWIKQSLQLRVAALPARAAMAGSYEVETSGFDLDTSSQL